MVLGEEDAGKGGHNFLSRIKESRHHMGLGLAMLFRADCKDDRHYRWAAARWRSQMLFARFQPLASLCHCRTISIHLQKTREKSQSLKAILSAAQTWRNFQA